MITEHDDERTVTSPRPRAAAYVTDLAPGTHAYTAEDGVGRCRENFARLVKAIERRELDVVVVYAAHLLFVDTSPTWMERFIVATKRHGILIADASSERQYNLMVPADEAAFRGLRSLFGH